MLYQAFQQQKTDNKPNISLSLLEISNAYRIPSPIPLFSNCECRTKAQLSLVTSDLSPIRKEPGKNLEIQSKNFGTISSNRKATRKVKTAILPVNMQTAHNFNIGIKSTATTPTPDVKIALRTDPLKEFPRNGLYPDIKSPFQKTSSNFMKGNHKESPRTELLAKNEIIYGVPNENLIKTKTKFKVPGLNEVMHRRTMSGSENYFKKTTKDFMNSPRTVATNQNKGPLIQKNLHDNQKKISGPMSNFCILCSAERSSSSRLSCGHMFCKNCIKGYIHSRIQEDAVPILCPGFQCLKEIIVVDVWRLVTIQDYQKFEKLIATE